MYRSLRPRFGAAKQFSDDPLTIKRTDKAHCALSVRFYPSSYYVFETQGHRISISNDRLGEALSQIESAGRDLLLLAYFLDLSDREIGALLGIPRSTIQRCRQRFLDQMKQLLKE